MWWQSKLELKTEECSIPADVKPSANSLDPNKISGPQSSVPPFEVVPEFSKVAPSGSIECLRRLVKQNKSQLMTELHEGEDKSDNASLNSSTTRNSPGVTTIPNYPNADLISDPNSVNNPDPNNHPDPNINENRQMSVLGTANTAGAWIWSKVRFNTTDEQLRSPAETASEPIPKPVSETTKASEKPYFRLFGLRGSTDSPEVIKSTGDESTTSIDQNSNTSSSLLAINTHPSLVLPNFDTIAGRSRLASLLWSNDRSQLFRAPAFKPKTAVIIGVHGYFPARMTRRFLGEPTGTSAKFANEAERQLKQWLLLKGESISSVKIDKIFLEGEGKIKSRIEVLYELLMAWRDLVASADFVLFAAHSQGAVVTTGIVDRLITEKVLNLAKQQVSVLAMAGSWLGPMPGLDQMLIMRAITKIENDSLLELFELQFPNLPLGQQLQSSLNRVLYSGVKVILVGSVDDQLIPVYSALALNTKHPNLFRAVYIDGQDVMPTVISPLLELAIRQLNAGYTDHSVIVEISTALAGALTSKGHSKLYSSDQVYDTALRVALETQAVHNVNAEFSTDFAIPQVATANPYRLPWSVQAIVNDCKQRKELHPIIIELFDQFRNWEPTTKALKDLQWRLVGLSHSKL